MHYRVRRDKGGKEFWIESAIFKIFGWYFMRMPVGIKKFGKGVACWTVPFKYETEDDALTKILEMRLKSLEFKRSKEFYGEWL
jgi:hypothetical protein